MQLSEAISLIKKGIVPQNSPQTWADLGAGKGLFSEALFSLLPGSTIHAVDLYKRPNLQHNPRIIFHQADFVKDILPVPTLDGILMANSLHYVQDQVACIQQLKTHLRNRTGVFILIEYDTDTGNEWVPYPVSFARAQTVFSDAGFSKIEKIGERSSIYRRDSIYAALISQSVAS
jgi:SAM-dependent methyltransferase